MSLPSTTDTKLWLAVLREIDDAGGQADPGLVCSRARRYFPEITDEDAEQTNRKTRQNTWTNRIHWARNSLAERGCIDRSVRGIWRMTPVGKRWLDDNWRGAQADYSNVAKPPAPDKAPGTATHTDPSVRIEPSVQPTPIRGAAPIRMAVEQLVLRLTEDQRKSNVPQQFERTIAEAFSFLGFEAQHIGGSGDTDILIKAPLGARSYAVVVDAKSTHNGRVLDSQINWPVIESHRQGRDATHAAVVGEDFSGGQLRKFADQYKVTLLTTGTLCEVLRLHDKTPLNLIELKSLFDVMGLDDFGIQSLRERCEQHRRHWQLLAKVIDTISIFDARRLGGFAPKVEQLHLALETQVVTAGQPYSSAPTEHDVQDAVTFLASRAAGILGEVSGSEGKYQLVVSPETARKRVLALARYIQREGSGEAETDAARVTG